MIIHNTKILVFFNAKPKKNMEEQKFKMGAIVYESVHPEHMLVITKVDGKFYHCKPQNNTNRPATVFPERDLKLG